MGKEEPGPFGGHGAGNPPCPQLDGSDFEPNRARAANPNIQKTRPGQCRAYPSFRQASWTLGWRVSLYLRLSPSRQGNVWASSAHGCLLLASIHGGARGPPETAETDSHNNTGIERTQSSSPVEANDPVPGPEHILITEVITMIRSNSCHREYPSVSSAWSLYSASNRARENHSSNSHLSCPSFSCLSKMRRKDDLGDFVRQRLSLLYLPSE